MKKFMLGSAMAVGLLLSSPGFAGGGHHGHGHQGRHYHHHRHHHHAPRYYPAYRPGTITTITSMVTTMPGVLIMVMDIAGTTMVTRRSGSSWEGWSAVS
ncbi:hypothetical protein BH20PSE1_BH20PSE1_22090 [soil metagenome]